MILPVDIVVIPNVARRMPPLIEFLSWILDFLAIWIVTLLLLSYSFVMFLIEGPFVFGLFVILLLSIFF